MTTPGHRDYGSPGWMHRWAMLTLLAGVAMLTLGAVVTTFNVGMADQVWPTYPWHLFLLDLNPQDAGFLIEHSHRLMGHVLGLGVVVLAVALWVQEPRPILRILGLVAVVAMIATLALGFALKTTGQAGFQEWALRRQAPVQFWLKTTGAWLICLCATTASVLGLLLVALRRKDPAFWLRWLGTTALAGIIVQGLLGGFRVQFNALFGADLAALHGVLAQILFAVLAGLAVLTSRSWNQSESEIVPPATPGPRTLFPTLSALLFGLILVQVFLGVLVRHSLWWVGPRGHLLVAFAVVITVFALALAVFTEPRSGPGLRRSTKILVGLIAVQLILGVEAWMGRLAPGGSGDFQAPTMYQAVTRVAHLLVGSWVLAASVVVALTARWPSRDKDCRLPIPNVKIHEEVS